MKGNIKTLKSVKFVLNMMYMKVIMGPLGEVSEHLQNISKSIDLLCGSLLEAYIIKRKDYNYNLKKKKLKNKHPISIPICLFLLLCCGRKKNRKSKKVLEAHYDLLDSISEAAGPLVPADGTKAPANTCSSNDLG